jgi:membrane-associated phospholipid phosphatase
MISGSRCQSGHHWAVVVVAAGALAPAPAFTVVWLMV